MGCKSCCCISDTSSHSWELDRLFSKASNMSIVEGAPACLCIPSSSRKRKRTTSSCELSKEEKRTADHSIRCNSWEMDNRNVEKTDELIQITPICTHSEGNTILNGSATIIYQNAIMTEATSNNSVYIEDYDSSTTLSNTTHKKEYP